MKDIIPLAERLRPSSLDEVVGQSHLTGPKGFITQMVSKKKPLSILLFGPPGSGKTSIARLFAKAFDMRFVSLSGVWDGIGELKKLIKEVADTPLFGKNLLLFVDEIHRFNKAQQDAFLPFVENGTVVLIGATAENPSFYLNPALLSRLRVLEVRSLDEASLRALLKRYEEKIKPLPLTDKGKEYLIHLSHGDGRFFFNLVENIEHLSSEQLHSEADLQEILQNRSPLYDRDKEHHYNLISALHKSVRGSDPDAALYWFARMLAGGEDPLFIARRMIRMASEDIGLADPDALPLAIAAMEAYHRLGSPEGELSLAEALVYLALCPKSNAIYKAFGLAKALAEATNHLPPPKIILNAPTKMMKQLDYGKGYRYDHEEKRGFSGQNYFPEGLRRPQGLLIKNCLHIYFENP
jgi:putative ATPase